VVVVQAEIARTNEVEGIRVALNILIKRTRPVFAVRTGVEETAIVANASGRKKDGV
jgi:hypothetical protein